MLDSNSNKPRLSRSSLAKEGIFYLERPIFSSTNSVQLTTLDKDSEDFFDSIREYLWDVAGKCNFSQSTWRIPAHVDWLREVLLDCQQLIPSYARNTLLREAELREIPTQAFFDDDSFISLTAAQQEEQRDALTKLFKDCRKHFMQRHIFEPYCEEGGSKIHGYCKDNLFDSYATRSNVLWNESKTVRGTDDSKRALSAPKPDIFFGFPIIRPNQQSAKGFQRSALVYNFSMAKLHSLLSRGLYCSPTTGLSNYGADRPFTAEKSQSISNDHLICFPFAVVELKHQSVGQSREQQCYCQAANAASVALNMLENLYSLAPQRINRNHVPAVVAFTCIGPKVRLWIAYALGTPDLTARLMICVWEGDMTSFWAVLEMQSIMKNLLRWATRVLRPNISTQISRWRLRLGRAGGPDQMFEDSHQVASDRKPLSKAFEEKGYWSPFYYELKRSAVEYEHNPSKKGRFHSELDERNAWAKDLAFLSAKCVGKQQQDDIDEEPDI